MTPTMDSFKSSLTHTNTKGDSEKYSCENTDLLSWHKILCINTLDQDINSSREILCVRCSPIIIIKTTRRRRLYKLTRRLSAGAETRTVSRDVKNKYLGAFHRSANE